MSKKVEETKVTPESKITSDILKESETLGDFATRHGLSIGKLRKLNDLMPTSRVKTGKRLVIK